MDKVETQPELAHKEEAQTPQIIDEGERSFKVGFSRKNIIVAIIIVIIIAIGILGYRNKGLFIAATVDGTRISRLTVIERLEKTSGKNVLNSLITEKLIANEAKAKGISVSDDEINAEIKNAQAQVAQQGLTLEEALKQQGMTMADFKAQIILRKDVEKLVGNNISVTDEEVAQYIKDNKVTIPSGQDAEIKTQIKEMLLNQKISEQADALITTLKTKAKINYYVNY